MRDRKIRTVLSCLTIVVLVACGGEDEPQQPDSSEVVCETHELRPSRYGLYEIVDGLTELTQDVEDPSAFEIYVIPNHWSPFWEAPRTGFEAAQAELGFSGEFKAACNKGDETCVEDQIELFQDLTDGDPSNGESDAIAVSCKDGEAMAPVITEAAEDVPIITFDSDVDNPMESGRLLYLGAMNEPAGREAGRTVFDLVQTGTVHLYAESFSTLNNLKRGMGAFEFCLDTRFSDASDFATSEYCAELDTQYVCEAECVGVATGMRLVAHAYGDEFAADAEWQSDHEEATAEDYLADQVAELLAGDDPPSGILTLQGTTSSTVAALVADGQGANSVRFVAWDLSDEIQAGLENGSVDATIAQNSYFYGYVAAYIAYALAAKDAESVLGVLDDYFEFGAEDRLLNTGISVVTPENLESYREYQVECLGLPAGSTG